MLVTGGCRDIGGAIAIALAKQGALVLVNYNGSRERALEVVGQIAQEGNQSDFSVSKAGLIGLTKSVARELAGQGVCVNAIAPGYIATDMMIPSRRRPGKD